MGVTLRWDDFSGGEYGTYDPRSLPSDSMWTGTNMRVYRDGSIGPRPGLKKATVTSNQNGVVWGVYNTPADGDDKQLVVVIGTTVYRADAGPDFTLTALSPGTIAATPDNFCAFDHLNPQRVVMVVPGDKCYDVDLTSSNQIAGISNSGAGLWVRIHKDRCYTSADPGGANPWRVHYSNAGAFTTWDAADYFDIGYWYPVYNAFSVKNRLVFGRQGNGGWHSLTGTPATGTLREIHHSLPPEKQSAAVIDDMDRIWFYTQVADQRGIVVTDGATWNPETYNHLRLAGTNAPRGVFSYGNRDILFYEPAEDDVPAFWRTDGAWTQHEFGVNIDGPETRYGFSRMLFVGGSDGATAGSYYWLDCAKQGPGFTSDTWAKPGDDSNTPVAASCGLSAKRAPRGGLFTANYMLVHLTAFDWDGGSSGGVGFRAWVKAYDRDGYSTQSSSKVSWSDDTGNQSTAGVERTVAVPVDARVKGAWLQPQFDQVKGVKIHAVELFEEYEPRQGGA